jgi:hypothetical protein
MERAGGKMATLPFPLSGKIGCALKLVDKSVNPLHLDGM